MSSNVQLVPCSLVSLMLVAAACTTTSSMPSSQPSPRNAVEARCLTEFAEHEASLARRMLVNECADRDGAGVARAAFLAGVALSGHAQLAYLVGLSGGATVNPGFSSAAIREVVAAARSSGQARLDAMEPSADLFASRLPDDPCLVADEAISVFKVGYVCGVANFHLDEAAFVSGFVKACSHGQQEDATGCRRLSKESYARAHANLKGDEASGGVGH